MKKIMTIIILFCILVLSYGCGEEAEPSLIPPTDVIESSKEVQKDATVDEPDDVEPAEVEADEESAEVEAAEPERDPRVRCYNNSDCGPITVMGKFCMQGGAYREAILKECKQQGTIDSYCFEKQGNELIELCDDNLELCTQGVCEEIARRPCDDSDGGKDEFTQGRVVDAKGEVYEDECKDSNNVMEAFCELRYFAVGTIGQLGAHEKIFCKDGCKEGACHPEED